MARGRAARGAVIIVAIVLLAELTARVLSPYLLPPTSPGAGEVVVKDRQLAALAPTTQVFFLGDSTMDAGVDPSAFTDESVHFSSAYNASLMGARLPSQRIWTGRVLRDHTPQLVVQAATPTLVSSLGVSPDDVSAYDAVLSYNLRQLDGDIWFDLGERAGDVSALVRYRSSLRNPRLLAGAAWDRVSGGPELPKAERPEGFWERFTTPAGQNTNFGQQVAKADNLGGLFDALRRLLDGRYDTKPLETLLEGYADRGIPAVVVVPPVSEPLFAAGGVSIAEWRAAAARIVAAGAEHGVPVLDYTSRTYAPELFADPLHLNTNGARRFSADLARDIDALCDRGLRCPTP